MSLAIIVMNFTLYRMFNACDRRNKLRFPEDERNSFKSNSLKSLFKSHLAIGEDLICSNTFMRSRYHMGRLLRELHLTAEIERKRITII